MATYRFRLHIRVMNAGQWSIMDELIFSQGSDKLMEGYKDHIDGRSLVIEKTTSETIDTMTLFAATMPIGQHLGECIVIADFVNLSDSKNPTSSGYDCKVGADFLDSNFPVNKTMRDTDIHDIEAWVKARGKDTPQSVIDAIHSFYGADPQTTMQGPWSIEKEIELRHNVFSKATFDEIVAIAKENFSRAAAIYQLAELDVKSVISLVQISGKIGSSHGREPNNAEKNLLSETLGDVVPSFLHQVFWRGIQEPFAKESADVIKQHLDSAPQLASSILDMVFCFIYSDGKVEKTDIANLKKLASILSLPMSTAHMSMQFGETTILHPIDYAAFVSAVDNDTVAYMAGGDGFVNVNLDGRNVGVRVISADMSEDEDQDPYEGAKITTSDDFAQNLDKIYSGELKRQTYELGKQTKINKLFFGVPDNCVSFQEIISDRKVSSRTASSLKNKFELLIVPKGFEDKLEAYQDLPFSVHCKKTGVSQTGFIENGIWRLSEKARQEKLIYLVCQNMQSGVPREVPIHYRALEKQLDVVYVQFGEGNDNGNFWCSYMLVVFHGDYCYSFMIYINAEENLNLFEEMVHDWVATITTKALPTKNTKVASSTTNKLQVELSNEEIDAKILDLLKNGEKYAVKKLRASDDDIDALSPQKLSAALRRMAQNGSLIKVDENGVSYYYAIKVLYDKTVKAFNSSKSIDKFDELLDTFSLLGEYGDAKAYVDKCREKINQINYNAAKQLISNATTSADMKKAINILNKLNDYSDSRELYAKATDEFNRLEMEERQKEEERKLQEEKAKKECEALLAALDEVSTKFCVNGDGFAIVTLDGRVKTYNCPPQMTAALSKWKNIKSIRLKISYEFDTFIAVGLKYNGTVVSFAQYSNAESEFNTSTWTDIVQIDVGYMHAIGLKRDGTVVATGNNAWDRCSVSSWNGIKKVVASTNGTIGLQKNGQIKIVGDDKGTNFSCKNVVDIAIATFVYALTEDGKLYEASPYDRQERSNKDWGEIAYISKNQSAVKCCTAITKGLKLRSEAINYDKVISKWNNIVGGGLWHDGVIGITADGYLKFEAPGKVIPDDIKNERLFFNFMTIEEDRKKAIEEAERKRVSRIKAEIEDLEKQMLDVKGLFAGIKKKSLQKKIDALKDQI